MPRLAFPSRNLLQYPVALDLTTYLVGVLDTYPFIFRLSNTLLVLIRDVRLAVVYGIAYVCLILEHSLDLSQRPVVTLFVRSVSIDVGECAIAGVVDPARSGHFLVKQHLTYLPGTRAVSREVENFLNYPLRVLVDYEGVFLLRVALVAERCVSERAFTSCVLGAERGLDFSAGILCEPLIGDGLFGKGIDKLEKT